MSVAKSEPVFVGKARLADNKLTVDGVACEVRDSSQLASFLQTSSAIIATALATTFGAEVGELVFPRGHVGEFQITGMEPWQQYSSAVLGFRLDPNLAKVVTGWCALLCVYDQFSPDHTFEPGAIKLAWYISTKAYKAAEASPDAVSAWDKYEEWARTLEGAIARLNGTTDMRNNPWAASTPLVLPAPSNLRHVTALDLVGAYSGDVLVTGGKARSFIGFEHSMFCVNDVAHVQQPQGRGARDYLAKLQVNGVEERFRVHADEHQMVLRLQPKSIGTIKPFSPVTPGAE